MELQRGSAKLLLVGSDLELTEMFCFGSQKESISLSIISPEQYRSQAGNSPLVDFEVFDCKEEDAILGLCSNLPPGGSFPAKRVFLIDENFPLQDEERLSAEGLVVPRPRGVVDTRALLRSLRRHFARWDGLQRDHQRFRAFMDHSPFEMGIKDNQGRFVAVNRHSLELYEQQEEIVVGKLPTQLFDDAAAHRLRAQDLYVIDNNRASVVEVAEETPTGQRSFISIKFPIPNGANRSPEVGCIAIDISDLKAAEERHRENHVLESTGRLTGGVAHEFNNLLAVILGRIECLSLADEDRQDTVDRIVRAVEKASGLTTQLLAHAGKLTLFPQPLHLRQVLGELEDALSQNLGPSIALSIEDCESLSAVWVDCAQLEIAIEALVANAQEAMCDGGRLRIACGLDQRTQGAMGNQGSNGRWVCLRFEDNGRGMSEETLKRAFDPFFTTKDVGQGAGLGLSMVRGFARQSGGDVRIESRPGQGTTVSLLLPIMEPR